LLGFFVFFKLMRHGVFFISRLLDIKYRPRMLAEAVTDMYTKTLGHSLHWFDSHLSGEIASKITDFQNSLVTLVNFCFRALGNVAMVIISLIFLSQVNVFSTAVIAAFVMIYTP